MRSVAQHVPRGSMNAKVLVVGTGFRWDELFMSAGNLSLFGASKLIDLRIPRGKPGRDGGEAGSVTVAAWPGR